MPEISKFYGIKIKMYHDDHGIAHFHAKSAEFEAVFAVDSLEVIVGDLPPKKRRLVEAWAEIHREELIANATRIEKGQKPRKIRPLR